MKRAKKEGFTQPASMLVKPKQTRGRVASSSTHSIAQREVFVKENSAVLCGNLLSDDDWDKRWERYIFMGKFKRGVVCALIAICATGLVLSVCAIIKMFMGV